MNRLLPAHHLLSRVVFLVLLRSELHPTTCCLSIHISLKLSDFNPKLFNLSRWGVPSERGVIYHIQESSIQAWSIAAFHRRPRPPQCLVSVFNAVKNTLMKGIFERAFPKGHFQKGTLMKGIKRRSSRGKGISEGQKDKGHEGHCA